VPDIHIFVSEVRSSRWPRFVIQDPWHRSWTGNDWGYDRTKARLFCNQDEASQTVAELTQATKVRMFSTAVNVYIESEEEFSVDELTDFLARNCKAWLGNDGGEHVLDGSTIKVEVEWEQVEEIE
jgi:hypothetical protein